MSAIQKHKWHLFIALYTWCPMYSLFEKKACLSLSLIYSGKIKINKKKNLCIRPNQLKRITAQIYRYTFDFIFNMFNWWQFKIIIIWNKTQKEDNCTDSSVQMQYRTVLWIGENWTNEKISVSFNKMNLKNDKHRNITTDNKLIAKTKILHQAGAPILDVNMLDSKSKPYLDPMVCIVPWKVSIVYQIEFINKSGFLYFIYILSQIVSFICIIVLSFRSYERICGF